MASSSAARSSSSWMDWLDLRSLIRSSEPNVLRWSTGAPSCSIKANSQSTSDLWRRTFWADGAKVLTKATVRH